MATSLPHTGKIILNSDREIIHKTLEAKFQDGYGQYAPNGINSKYEIWSITWGGLTTAQKNDVVSALDTEGGYGKLLWTPCGDTTQKTYRLVNGKYKISRPSPSLYEISCNLEQRFD